MTEDQNIDHDVELHDDENEIMEANGSDEEASVKSADAASDASG